MTRNQRLMRFWGWLAALVLLILLVGECALLTMKGNGADPSYESPPCGGGSAPLISPISINLMAAMQRTPADNKPLDTGQEHAPTGNTSAAALRRLRKLQRRRLTCGTNEGRCRPGFPAVCRPNVLICSSCGRYLLEQFPAPIDRAVGYANTRASEYHLRYQRDYAVLNASEYSGWSPPNTDFVSTSAPTLIRCRDSSCETTAATFGKWSTPGPRLLCGRPRLQTANRPNLEWFSAIRLAT